MSSLPVPRKILDQHVAVLGKTRSGKSSVMRLLVEDLLTRQLPVCIVDPKGDWWGIKLAADGKSPGFPVVIFGGEHADVPITELAGGHVAELFATGNRPCLIDLGGWMPGARTRFWVDFASTLFRVTKGQRWLAIDEIHNFAPKGKVFDPDAGKALHWTNRLASEGLGKGVSMVFASQRPQKVHNDTLTSAETLIAMRVLHPSDRGAVSDWIRGVGDSQGTEVLNSLAQMARGEGWVWSPEIHFGPKRVAFPLFTTYDSFRPQTIQDTKRLKGWAEVDLDDVRAKLATVVEKAKADDPVELRKTIAALRKELAAKPIAAPASKEKITVREKPIIDLRRLEILMDRAQRWAARVGQMEVASGTIRKDFECIGDLLKQVSQVASAASLTFDRQQGWTPNPIAGRRVESTTHRAADRPRPAVEKAAAGNVTSDLPQGERKVLTAVLQYPTGLEKKRLTVLIGLKRSTRDEYTGRLARKGLVELRGGLIYPTDAGRAALAGQVEALPTGAALIEHWRQQLPPGEKKIFDVVIAAAGADVDRETVYDAIGLKRSSADEYMSRMQARGVLEKSGPGTVRAAAELFQ